MPAIRTTRLSSESDGKDIRMKRPRESRRRITTGSEEERQYRKLEYTPVLNFEKYTLGCLY
jgi:hypothetical protein